MMARLPRPTPPRGLIFLASAWLIVAWVMTMGFRPPIQMHAASYTPSVRLLLLSLVFGIGVGWPLVRLSGGLRAWPIRQTLLDLLVLLCLSQVVVWPLRLVTPWPPIRSLAIDLLLVGWSLAIAAVVATGSTPVRRGLGVLRTAAMAVIVVLVAGMPLLSLLRNDALPFAGRPVGELPAQWWQLAALSPATAMDALSGGGPTPPLAAEWAMVRLAWWTAAGLWLSAILLRTVLPRIDESPEPMGPALSFADLPATALTTSPPPSVLPDTSATGGAGGDST